MSDQSPATIIDFLSWKGRRNDGGAPDRGPEVLAPPFQAAQLLDGRVTVSPESDPKPVKPKRPRSKEPEVVMVRAALTKEDRTRRSTYSLVLPNGDVYHFFPLAGGVQHSYTRRSRGHYDEAVRLELERPDAEIVGKFKASEIASAS